MSGSNRLPVLVDEIAVEHRACKAAVKNAVQHAIEAGRRLIEAKTLVPHGAWLPWLAEHLPDVSARTVQRYMKAAELAGKNDNVSFSSLRALLAPPKAEAIDAQEAVEALLQENERRLCALMRVVDRAIKDSNDFHEAWEIFPAAHALQVLVKAMHEAWQKNALLRFREFSDTDEFRQELRGFSRKALHFAVKVGGPIKDWTIDEREGCVDKVALLAATLTAAWLTGSAHVHALMAGTSPEPRP
jgi:hypothetical protein